MQQVSIDEGQANFAALVAKVKMDRDPVLVLLHGEPAVKLVPVDADDDALAIYKIGGGKIVGDVSGPTGESDSWDYD